MEEIKRFNSAIDSSVTLTDKRRLYFDTIKKHRLEKSVNKVCGTSLFKRIVKRILKITK